MSENAVTKPILELKAVDKHSPVGSARPSPQVVELITAGRSG